MTPEQGAAYIYSQANCAMIEALGMQAENAMREVRGESPAYVKDDFDALLCKYGVHHNAVCAFLNGV